MKSFFGYLLKDPQSSGGLILLLGFFNAIHNDRLMWFGSFSLRVQ